MYLPPSIFKCEFYCLRKMVCKCFHSLLLSPPENLDDDHDGEEQEQLVSEDAGFRDERTATDGNFYAPLKFGAHARDALERGHPVASPLTASTNAAAIDTPALTVKCSKASFQIALRAGRLRDVHVKGECRSARSLPHHPLKWT